MKTTATRLTFLAEADATATHPAFSRDGTYLLFVGGGHQLMRVPTAGGDVTWATGEVLVRGMHPRVQPAVNE